MTRRGTAQLAVLLSAICLGLALPAFALAASGGGGLGGSSAPATTGAPSAADGPVSASAGGITITTRSEGFLGSQIHFSGQVDPGAAGGVIEIERSGHETNWGWAPTVETRVRRDGSFYATWQANHIGRFAIRAVLRHAHAGGAAADSWPTVSVIVYRRAVATWYGPGEYGSTTACGIVLRSHTIGVAHRTLPCGTKVALYYRGKAMIVPVIDRGPYSRADWDLTEATAQALGTKAAGVVTLGSVSLPARR